MVFVDIVVYSV